jgi:hypothetical protein
VLARALNGIKTVGYVPLRSTIIANHFYPLKQALSRCAEPTKVPIEYIILIETVKLKDVR